MRGAVYQVTGQRRFRGHHPGDTFVAVLDPAPENRAVARGDIRVIRRIDPQLQPGSYALPVGWANQQKEEVQ